MQAAYDAVPGPRLVVLHERRLDAGLFTEMLQVEAFEEITAVITEDLGLDEQDAR
jgi:hypothetical protein